MLVSLGCLFSLYAKSYFMDDVIKAVVRSIVWLRNPFFYKLHQ